MSLKHLTTRMPAMVLSSLILISAAKQVDAQSDDTRVTFIENSRNINIPVDTTAINVYDAPFADQMNIELKADGLCNQYLDNMIRAQKKLAPYIGTKSYRNEVRKELPGAPVGHHCIYGWFTHLTRALNEVGDTIKIVPLGQNAQNSCVAFKNTMRRKYSAPEYAACISEGKLYASNIEYDAAFETFVSRQGIKSDNPDSLRQVLSKQFAKKNFSIESINPGSIIIVPRYFGSKNLFHAIMYPGVGIKDGDGNFIPTPDGVPMFVAHNNERLGDLFQTWDTNNVFVADIKKIAMVEYNKELDRIRVMTRDELIAFLETDKNDSKSTLKFLPQTSLLKLARAKYFGYDISKAQDQEVLAEALYAPELYTRINVQALQRIR